MSNTQTENALAQAIEAEIRSLAIRIEMVTASVQQNAADILASANAFKRDVDNGWHRKDQAGFLSTHVRAYEYNATELESLKHQQRVLMHIINTTEGE